MFFNEVIKRIKKPLAVICGVTIIFSATSSAFAIPSLFETGLSKRIQAAGIYANWDGVTNVSQFKGPNDRLFFAVDGTSAVTVYKTDRNQQITGTITLTKTHPIFGTCLCDSSENYYLVTGESNSSDNKIKETVFISKYDSSGNLLRTVGDNGHSSLPDSVNADLNTKIPFNAGNCDAAISGNILSVHYAREMYSGHQSDSVFSVNINTLQKINVNYIYQSHSFAQRVISTNDGFAYVSEGDAHDRAFAFYSVNSSNNTLSIAKSGNLFDFWIQHGAADRYNMTEVNQNYAHMGGIVKLFNGSIAFVAQSAQSLDSNAKQESEEVFIQIFDPTKDLSSAAAYRTTGTRSGLSGFNGDEYAINYGVKWLTNYGRTYSVKNVQVAYPSVNNIVVLYELWQGNNYRGLYYIVLNESGNITREATRYSENALLNPCEMPVDCNGKILWVGNRHGNAGDKLYVYSLDPTVEPVSVDTAVTAKTGLIYNRNEQALVNAGQVTGGNLSYAVTESEVEAPANFAYLPSIPKVRNAGTYYVWYKITGDSSHYDGSNNYVRVEIGKAPSRVIKAPTPKNLANNGNNQQLINPGTAENGTMVYALSSFGNYAPAESSYTAQIPTGSRGGEYTIWYKVRGNANYADTEPISMKVRIKNKAYFSSLYDRKRTLTYTGQPMELVDSMSAVGGTIVYALGNDSVNAPVSGYSESIPRATEPGTYYVWCKAIGDSNHGDSEAVCCTASIYKDTDTDVINGDDDYNNTGNSDSGTVNVAFTIMYRLYNPNSGEHFYTREIIERDNLVRLGWNYEGIGWYAPKSGAPVYRLYNENAGDHHYTTSAHEKDVLVNAGWEYEGVAWYSAPKSEGKPLYRLYNPNAVSGAHHYTQSEQERDNLISIGWKDEEIGWYGLF